MAKERSLFDSWRIWATAFAWLAVCVSTALAARTVERFVSRDPQFTLSLDRRDGIRVDGVVYASRTLIARIFARDFGRSIYLMPLAERRRRLVGIDWVKEATVSRIWPNRILVRITERTPVAFVNLPLAENARTARLSLIDAEGEFLEPPAAGNFKFPVLLGVTEQQPKEARHMRVQAMQQLLEELGPLAVNVSEVNAGNVEDMRIVAQVASRAFELDLGDGGFKKRLQHFINHYPEIRRKAPEATSFDLRLDDQIIKKE